MQRCCSAEDQDVSLSGGQGYCCRLVRGKAQFVGISTSYSGVQRAIALGNHRFLGVDVGRGEAVDQMLLDTKSLFWPQLQERLLDL